MFFTNKKMTQQEKKPKERKFLVSSNFVRNENKPPTNRLRKNQSEWKSALLPSSSTTTRLKRDLVLWLWVWSSLPSEGCCHSDREPAQAPPPNEWLARSMFPPTRRSGVLLLLVWLNIQNRKAKRRILGYLLLSVTIPYWCIRTCIFVHIVHISIEKLYVINPVFKIFPAVWRFDDAGESLFLLLLLFDLSQDV